MTITGTSDRADARQLSRLAEEVAHLMIAAQNYSAARAVAPYHAMVVYAGPVL
jgi:hypothetical protein